MSKVRENTLEQQDRLNSYSDQLKSLTIEIPDDLHLRIQRYYKRLCNEPDVQLYQVDLEAA